MIYLDYAATTPVDPAVLAAMMPYFSDRFGNPSSLHTPGQTARQAADEARRTCAKLLGAKSPREIVFTSGGTESNNLAIFGVAEAYAAKGAPPVHFITSAIEHESVLEPMKELENRGCRVTYLPVDREGVVKLNALKNALTPKTKLVSIMAANNEVGTLQPIAEIAKIIQEYKKSTFTTGYGLPTTDFPLLHTDACQAAETLNLPELTKNVDLLTLNASKIYGPKGIGLLYIREKIKLTPLFYGGGQEHKRRSGTENVPSIMGLAAALELAVAHSEEEKNRLTQLRNQLWEGLQKHCDGLILNGPPCTSKNRLANNLNLIVKGIEGEILLMRLDQAGIYASAGSACTAGSTEPSHVLRAMGISKQDAYSAIRFSLGHSNTRAQIDDVIQAFTKIAREIREQSGR